MIFKGMKPKNTDLYCKLSDLSKDTPFTEITEEIKNNVCALKDLKVR